MELATIEKIPLTDDRTFRDISWTIKAMPFNAWPPTETGFLVFYNFSSKRAKPIEMNWVLKLIYPLFSFVSLAFVSFNQWRLGPCISTAKYTRTTSVYYTERTSVVDPVVAQKRRGQIFKN